MLNNFLFWNKALLVIIFTIIFFNLKLNPTPQKKLI